jgi:hypothetical protein
MGQITPEELAQAFHEIYERLAPDFGYETRRESAVPWEELPEPNKQLMIAVCKELLSGVLAPPPNSARTRRPRHP